MFEGIGIIYDVMVWHAYTAWEDFLWTPSDKTAGNHRDSGWQKQRKSSLMQLKSLSSHNLQTSAVSHGDGMQSLFRQSQLSTTNWNADQNLPICRDSKTHFFCQ